MGTYKSKKYNGVYISEGIRSTSYGIDYIHPQTGQRIRKILKDCKGEAEAAEIRSIEVADAKRGAINKAYGIKDKPCAVLFKTMVKKYLAFVKEDPDHKSHEADRYNSIPLVKFFKGRLMSDINPWMIERYKAARIKSVAKRTVNNELVVGSQVFKKAEEWGRYDGINPFKAVSRFKIPKGKKPGALTHEEVVDIINNIAHPVKKDMVAFAYYAGWRISEIRKLKWEDVNIDNGTAWIVEPKNKKTVEIELGDEALAIISRQKKRSELVFCHLNGKPYKTNLHKVFKGAALKAGVYLPPRKAWHILRRTWASMMLQNGCDVETLRVLGNWRSNEMPLWYAEAAGRKKRKKALNKIPKLSGRNLAEMVKADKSTN